MPPSERVGEVRSLLDEASAGTGPDSNIFATLVKAPRLYRRWIAFGGRLLHGVLEARERELLILRTAWNCSCAYEWGQHALIAARDLSPEEIARVPAGPTAPGWGEIEATLLQAADELHDTYSITDGTFASLAARYDEEQLIEVPMLVGHYHLVAMTLNSLGVEADPGLPPFPVSA